MNTSKQIIIMIAVVFLAVFATGAYTLWDPDRADEAEGRQVDKTIERGAYLFSQNCRTCHGDVGEGGAASNRLRAAPPLNALAVSADANEVQYADQYKFIYYTITCGRVGRVMPAWGQSQGGPLNDEQIRQLTSFILSGEGWQQAQEFAIHGVPDFHRPGDDQYHLKLAADLSETDTMLRLETVRGVPTTSGEVPPVVIFPNERLSIQQVTTQQVDTGEKDGNGQAITREEQVRETVEIMVVQSADEQNNTVTVERGVGTTSAGAFPAGTDVLKPPVPPTDPAPVERSCGQLAGAAGPTPTPAPPSTQLSIIAKGIAWNTTTLTAIAGEPLSISIDNQDEGIAHNWHLTQGADPGGAEIPNGAEEATMTQIQSGPITESLDFGPLEAGEYHYVCDVHTNMEGVLTATEAGAAPAAPAGATPTP